MNKTVIKAEVVADSLSPKGERITTYELVFPRFILAELNTHRVFSKNSASSRAIPFKKMKEMVINDPFIPIAWQKDHKGMQGVEYYTEDDIYFPNGKSCKENGYNNMIHFHTENWDEARLLAVSQASILNTAGVTKQLCNRLLEPFMWHKVLLTATEFENFFELRCPQYEDPEGNLFKSKKEYHNKSDWKGSELWRKEDWYGCNRSQAEIHIQALAEAMYDAMNESIPKKLKAGEWHIPYGDNLSYYELAKIYAGFKDDVKLVAVDGWELTGFDAIDEPILKRKFFHSGIQVATARCARLSYQTVGDNPKIDYEADIRLHDMLLKHHHMSPFEHCAQAMSNEEFKEFTRTIIDKETKKPIKQEGWLANFRGFKQYRHLI